MKTYRQEGVRTEALATILRREVDRRGHGRLLLNGGPTNNRAYAASLSDEIAASGLMGLHAAKRRLWSILSEENEVVNLDTADKILTALDLSYLWHTELSGAIVTPVCSECGSDHNEQGFGCKRCSDRFALRRKRALAAPPPALRTAAGGGTTLERSAA